LAGSWVDWTSDASLKFITRHNSGEESHVELYDVKFYPHPLDIDWFQSNPIEFLTDTLSPSGSEYMDGDWVTGFTVQNTGNPITNGKYVRYPATASGSAKPYSLDSAIDGRRFDTLRFWIRSSQAGNHRIYILTDTSNLTYYLMSLTANVWTEINIPFPNTDDPVGDSGWTSETGSYDPSSITIVRFVNNTGSAADLDIYGLQFLSSEHEKEYFVPQTLDVEWDAGNSKYGSFYINPNERARLYKVIADGNIWIENWDIDWMENYHGHGLYGDPQYLYLEASGDTVTFYDDVSIAGACTIVAGTLRAKENTHTISVGGLLTVKSGGTFAHSAWAPTSDCEIGSIVCEGGTIHFPAVSGGGKLLITGETKNYAIKVTRNSTIYHHSGHIQIDTPSNTLAIFNEKTVNILEVTSGNVVFITHKMKYNELRETSGSFEYVDYTTSEGESYIDKETFIDGFDNYIIDLTRCIK